MNNSEENLKFYNNLKSYVMERLELMDIFIYSTQNTLDEISIKENSIKLYKDYLEEYNNLYGDCYIDLCDFCNDIYDSYVIEFYKHNIKGYIHV